MFVQSQSNCGKTRNISESCFHPRMTGCFSRAGVFSWSDGVSDYSERLKDPRWQRKRLEIMQRSDFKCEHCGSSISTLNVHHGYYRRGAMPWEYDNDVLHCLCENCHDAIERLKEAAHRAIARMSMHEMQRLLDGELAWFGGNEKQQVKTRLVVRDELDEDTKDALRRLYNFRQPQKAIRNPGGSNEERPDRHKAD